MNPFQMQPSSTYKMYVHHTIPMGRWMCALKMGYVNLKPKVPQMVQYFPTVDLHHIAPVGAPWIQNAVQPTCPAAYMNPQCPAAYMNPQCPAAYMNPQCPAAYMNPQCPAAYMNPQWNAAYTSAVTVIWEEECFIMWQTSQKRVTVILHLSTHIS